MADSPYRCCTMQSYFRKKPAVKQGASWIVAVWTLGHKATQTDEDVCRKEPERWCSAHASLSLGILPLMVVSSSCTCLYRDHVYLVKKHHQVEHMGVNRGFSPGTQNRKRTFLLTVKGDRVLCTGLIKSLLLLISQRAHRTLWGCVSFPSYLTHSRWVLMPWHHFTSFQKTQL